MLIKPLQLGAVRLQSNLILAPLCGCSSLPTRLLAKENGAALVFPEMAKSEALVRATPKTLKLLYFEERERPVGIQICGGDPETMAESAKRAADLGPDLIDINMGCPVKKIVNTDAGCALLKDPAKAEQVIAAVVHAVPIPVTVKMRAGWDESSLKHRELARAVENAGAAAVTLHPRTRCQFFEGKADWDLIGEVKQEVKIPVIGNGDIHSPRDMERMFRQTGCDGIMIGRAALGYPWIFRDALHYFEHGETPDAPGTQEVLQTLLRHFELMMKIEGEGRGIVEMRRHAAWYIKGKPGTAQLRQQLNTLSSPEDFYDLIDQMDPGFKPDKPLQNTAA